MKYKIHPPKQENKNMTQVKEGSIEAVLEMVQMLELTNIDFQIILCK